MTSGNVATLDMYGQLRERELGYAPWVENVRSGRWGATGNGITVDTGAIQAAINWRASQRNGGFVYLPAGTYLMNASLTKPYNVGILGDGAFITNLSCGSAPSFHGITISPPTNAHTVMEGFSINGTGAATGDGIHWSDGSGTYVTCTSVMRDVRVNGMFNGIYVGQYWAGVSIDNCQTSNNQNDGVKWAGTDADISRLVSTGNTSKYGIEFTSTAAEATVRGCSIGNNLGGILDTGSTGQNIINCGIDHNQQWGLFMGGSGGGTVVSGCHFHSNSQAGNNLNPDIVVGQPYAMIENNKFFLDAGQTNKVTTNIHINNGAFWVSTKSNQCLNSYNTSGLTNFSIPAVPATGVASSTFGWDSDIYVTAGTSTCALKIGSGGNLCTLPASSVGHFFIPAGSTVTLTYTNAPTWQGVLHN